MIKVDRKAHILQENKGIAYPREMIFFDIESHLEQQPDKIVHHPYLWGGCYVRLRNDIKKGIHEEWKFCNNSDEFVEWVVSKVRKKIKLYLFAHNPAYDGIAGQLFKGLYDRGYRIKFDYENGMSFIAKFIKDKRSIVVLNTHHWFPYTVREIGKMVGIEKLEIDYNEADFDTAHEYNKTDIEIIKTAMLQWFEFCKKNNLGNFGLTAPGQAFNAFRHRFMKYPIYIHNNQDVCSIEREAYYGGRTECFFIGRVPEKEVIELDVNSMYPSVMKDNLYPVKLVGWKNNISRNEFKDILEKYLVVAKVRAKVDYPCVPVRVKENLIFPVGEFITTLCTPEIKLLEEYGRILDIIDCVIYEAAPIFHDYVSYFYNLRLEAKKKGDKIHDKLYKLMLNSLYGKFAQKISKWVYAGETDRTDSGYGVYVDNETGKKYNMKWFLGAVYKTDEEYEGRDSFPAIAAHVTSYARVKLFEGFMQAGFENVYYTDTDSMYVSKTGYERMQDKINQSQLGAWGFEGTRHNMVIFGPKDYRCDEKTRLKGVNVKEWKELEEGKYEGYIWPKLPEFIRNNSLAQYYNKRMIKVLKREYTKGWIRDDGRILPLELVVNDGENIVLEWENTSYYAKGYKLLNQRQKEWVLEKYK